MALSEQSFADRAQKAQQLHDACNGFTPVYVPSPGTITLPLFQTMVDSCSSLNAAAGVASNEWSDVANQRATLAKLIAKTTTHLIGYIAPVKAWKSKYPQAKRLADAIRGDKAPRKPVPPPPPGEPPKKQIQRGGQSYAEIEQNFDSLVTLAIALVGFAPPDATIAEDNLNDLRAEMKALNKAVSEKEAALSDAQKVRYAAYYDTDGLSDRFKEVKGNVKGQYGISSTQWAQVRGMKW